MGIGGLVAGLIALAASLVPLTGAALALPACAVSVGLGTCAIKRQRQKRTAVAGLVSSGLSLVVVFIIMPIWVRASPT